MKQIHIAVAALGIAFVGSACAADLDAGRKIVEAQCAACHGKDGKTPVDPTYPKIAGQYSDYLTTALHDYQTGARKNAIMNGMAKPLSANDVQNVAAYLASLPSPLKTPTPGRFAAR